ncbi:MAG TPA: AAA family ATPase [Candidatus Sulfotelmatobacter sp.]|nr:AAA family ATPase [Candidatus Sulfotelmatobacter sp.]
MFLQFYGLREQPFGVTPNPRFLYMSPTHREALASLFYGIDAERGFMALIAKPGMGKTNLLFQLLQQFQSKARTAFLFQTQCTSREFMRFLLLELGCEVNAEQDLVSMHEQFNRCLLQEAHAGRRFILVVDEAQNLEASVLETIRLLSDFETPQAKLLQIVLAGQPELADKLAKPSLRQLRQRISVLATLAPLTAEEVARYMNHRLRAAGRQDGLPFTGPAVKMIARLSEGIPRNVNNICFNALSLGCALRQKTVDVDVLQQVAEDFDLSNLRSEPGVRSFEQDTPLSLPKAAPDPETLLAMKNPAPANVRHGELSNPEDARAYMQEFIRRFKKDQYLAN